MSSFAEDIYNQKLADTVKMNSEMALGCNVDQIEGNRQKRLLT